MAAEHKVTGVIDGLFGGAPTGIERGQRHKRFVGRTGRIRASECAVQQRLVWRFIELLPVVDINAFDEQVGVKGGLADKRQYLAVTGVNGHQSPSSVPIHFLNQLL